MDNDQERINFYANNVNVVSGLYDVTLQFSVQTPVGPIESNKQPLVETAGICNVRMSPQHAKALAAILVNQVAAYEEQFNMKLPLPPELTEMWNKYMKG